MLDWQQLFADTSSDDGEYDCCIDVLVPAPAEALQSEVGYVCGLKPLAEPFDPSLLSLLQGPSPSGEIPHDGLPHTGSLLGTRG